MHEMTLVPRPDRWCENNGAVSVADARAERERHQHQEPPKHTLERAAHSVLAAERRREEEHAQAAQPKAALHGAHTVRWERGSRSSRCLEAAGVTSSSSPRSSKLLRCRRGGERGCSARRGGGDCGCSSGSGSAVLRYLPHRCWSTTCGLRPPCLHPVLPLVRRLPHRRAPGARHELPRRQ